ncbi:hypothetical protein [Hydrogenophaga sp.]|uniref:hypothetical protein n=1 Tax=Hydrogenophaga sp. TaxID=1904254 RepID=UPI003D0BFDA8
MKQGDGFAACSRMGALVLIFMLAACGGGGNSASTPQEAIAQLEAAGELPKLERESTLGGIDANANGVRDDIEAHIERKYTEPAQRAAAMQTARDYQQMLLVDKSDAVAVQTLIDAGARASNCSFEVFGGLDGFQRSYQMSRELEAMTTNTKDRLKAYLDFNRAASGSVSSSPKENVCD